MSKESIIQFSSTDKQFKAPFVVYADFECLTKPITKGSQGQSDFRSPVAACKRYISGEQNRSDFNTPCLRSALEF